MPSSLLRQVLRSPVRSLADGYRHWRRHGACIRRAGVLCQCADGIRLRHVRGWEERSLRLYRRATALLRDLATGDGQGEESQDWARSAHRALWLVQEPYRALAAACARSTGLLAVATLLIVLAVSAISQDFRARLFPRDLAQGRPWTASSADPGYAASGVGPSSDGPLFFHTTFLNHPSVEIDLGAEHVIRGILVENRSDCCQERALPLNVEIFDGSAWQLVAQRRAAFATWKYDLGPVRARKVRLLHAGTDFLHLKRVSIYGQ